MKSEIYSNMMSLVNLEHFVKIVLENNNTHIINTVSNVFERNSSAVFDKRLLNSIMLYVNTFLRKNEDHINFFGGGLLGVYQIRFDVTDSETWIRDIVGIDNPAVLEDDIYDIPDVNKDFNVSSNYINLSYVWMIYKVLNMNNISDKDKYHVACEILNMMQYKFITSIHTNNFTYSANIEVSTALYESLSNKSDIKVYGTWKALVNARTAGLIPVGSDYYNLLMHLDDDYEVVKFVNDVWNRMKSVMKILTDGFHTINNQKGRIAASSMFMMVDGKEVLKDNTNKYTSIKQNMRLLLHDPNGFIKSDLLKVSNDIMNAAYPKLVEASLRHLLYVFQSKAERDNVEELIDNLITFIFTIIRKEKLELTDITSIGIKLRGVFRSSRILSPEFMSIKDRMDVYVNQACPNINPITLSNTRIAVCEYISLRALLAK